MKPGLFMLKWKRDGEFLVELETADSYASKHGWSARWGARGRAIGFPYRVAQLLKRQWVDGAIVLVRMKDHSGTSRNNKDR